MRPPPLSAFPHYLTTGGTCLLAFALAVFERMEITLDPLVVGYQIMGPEPWRLLTSTLVHGDIFHLLFNLYWTWCLGTLVESKYGSLRTLLIFVYLALVAGGLEFAFLQGGVGLSGVVYGLWGLFFAMRGLDLDASAAANRNNNILFIAWFFICVVGSWMGTMRIANIAHGMGAVAGMCLGKAILSVRYGPRVYYRMATALLLVGSVTLATRAREYVNLSNRWSIDLYWLSDEYYKEKNFEAGNKTLARISSAARWRTWLRNVGRTPPAQNPATTPTQENAAEISDIPPTTQPG